MVAIYALRFDVQVVISINRSSKCTPFKLCKVSNKEIQIDFGGPIYKEKDQEVYFHGCKDHFSIFPTNEVFVRANAQNASKFLQDYALPNGIRRTVRHEQATCQISE